MAFVGWIAEGRRQKAEIAAIVIAVFSFISQQAALPEGRSHHLSHLML